MTVSATASSVSADAEASSLDPDAPGRGSGLVSWPMYAVEAEGVASFWEDLRTSLVAAGLAATPEHLSDPADDLFAHWCDPSLLLSQTCGYPFVTSLRGRVRYVCTPRFRAPGCGNGAYRSAIVIRDGEAAQALPDLRGCRAAYNSGDSHSGYNAFRFLVAPHARNGRFFADAIETGSHRASLAAVRSGRADVAAIDAVTLALVGATRPNETAGLRVLAYSAAAPALPLITSLATSDEQLERLRYACMDACDRERPGARGLLLEGVTVLDESAYDRIAEMRTLAEDLGYPELA